MDRKQPKTVGPGEDQRPVFDQWGEPIDRSEWGRMAEDARRRGFDISEKTLGPTGPEHAAYLEQFAYAVDERRKPNSTPVPDPPQGSGKRWATTMMLGSLGVLALIGVLLGRACRG